MSRAGEEQPWLDGEPGGDAVFGGGDGVLVSALRAAKAEHGLLRGLGSLTQREDGLAGQKPLQVPKRRPSASLPRDVVPSLRTKPPPGRPMAPAPPRSRRHRVGFLPSCKLRGQGETSLESHRRT